MKGKTRKDPLTGYVAVYAMLCALIRIFLSFLLSNAIPVLCDACHDIAVYDTTKRQTN